MKRNLKILLVLVGVLVCCAISVAFVSTEEAQNDEEKNIISENLLHAKEVMLTATEISTEQAVKYDAVNAVNIEENTATAVMTDALKDKESEIDTYYSSNLADVYKSNAKDAITREFEPAYERPEGVTKEITIRSGILDFNVTDCVMAADTAVVSSKYVGWSAFIEEVVPEKEYLLTMPMSIFTDENRMICENGQWKINENITHNQEFAPLSYDPVIGTYASLEEAISAAEALDPVAMNPF